MEKKKFHIGDVVSVVTHRLVSPRGKEGILDFLSFMIGYNIFDHEIGRAMDLCMPYLFDQFPQLKSSEMQFATGELIEMLKTPSGKSEPDMLILGWLSSVVHGSYGLKIDCDENLLVEVESLPQGVCRW
ncbi:MAG TPA: hypothetical protein PLB38_01680 [bacterium]|nr:hypothetical protein [bacterium]